MTVDFDVVDVIVVGSGGGITGAYTAAREGLSVALVEATDKFGGTTAYSGGGNPIGASMLFSHIAALDMAWREPTR
jgi:succinate dehydrogenase/fumarate reductase flavoprotein subunit